MARRKLPTEIVAKAVQDLDGFARESAKAAQDVRTAAREFTKLAEAIARPEWPNPDEAVRQAQETLNQHLAENVWPYLIRPEPERPKSAIRRRRKGQPPGFEDWYIKRTRCVPYSSRDDDLAAAREAFGQFTKDWEILRELRTEHAPDSWKKPGP